MTTLPDFTAAQIAKIEIQLNESARRSSEIRYFNDMDQLLGWSIIDRIYPFSVNPTDANLVKGYSAYRRGSNPAPVFYIDSQRREYAETAAAHQDLVTADSTTTVRAPQTWMQNENYFLQTYLESLEGQNTGGTTYETGTYAPLTIWGHFASSTAAENALPSSTVTWNGTGFDGGLPSDASDNPVWVLQRSEIGDPPAGEFLFSAFTSARVGEDGAWSQDEWTVRASSHNTFNTQYTSDRNPTDASATSTSATGALYYRVRDSVTSDWGEWIPIHAANHTHWRRLGRYQGVFDAAHNEALDDSFNLDDFEDLLFNYTWYTVTTNAQNQVVTTFRGHAEARMRAADFWPVASTNTGIFNVGHSVKLKFEHDEGGMVVKPNSDVWYNDFYNDGNHQAFSLNLSSAFTPATRVVNRFGIWLTQDRTNPGIFTIYGR